MRGEEVRETRHELRLPAETLSVDVGCAIELVIDSGKASVSMLQRRFRIGYNRAARIVDIMEEMGVVGPQDGSSPRQVIMTREEFEQLQSAQESGEEQEMLF